MNTIFRVGLTLTCASLSLLMMIWPVCHNETIRLYFSIVINDKINAIELAPFHDGSDEPRLHLLQHPPILSDHGTHSLFLHL